MTEVTKDPSGMPEIDPVDNSGDQSVDPADNAQVSRRAYQKALTEKKAAQARLRELEEMDAKRRQEQLDQEGSMQEKLEFYKSKLDEAQNEMETVKGELSGQRQKWETARKVSAVRDAMPFSLPSKYLVHIDVDSVMLDPETGKPDSASVKKVVDGFQEEYPEIVSSFTKKSNSFNEFPAANTSGKLTPQEWAKLPYDQKQARKGDVQFN